MLHDFSTGLDFLAALCTLLYIGRLLVQRESGVASFCHEAKKRSLLNQQIHQRAA